jgi:hypothetical protein
MMALLMPLLAAQPKARDMSDAVDCAVGLVHAASTGPGYPMVIPPPINLSEDSSGNYAELFRDPPGTGVPVEIKLYMPSIRARLPDWEVTTRPDSFACGALASHVAHEMFHQCITPARPGAYTCQKKPNSCVHLAIDHAVHEILCAAAQDTKEGIAAAEADGDTEEAIKLTEQLIALCEEARELEDKWNTPDRADKAMSCKDGADSCPIGRSQMASMEACFESGGGTTFPCPPGGEDDFPDNEVLEPCSACADIP